MAQFDSADRSQRPRLRFAQYAAADATGIVAAFSLVGWLSGRLLFASVSATYVPMAPVTALTLLVVAAVVVLRTRSGAGVGRSAVLAVSGLVVAVMAFELLDIATGLHVAPDRLFLTAAQLADPTRPGRMSPVTIVACIAMVLAIVLFDSRRDRQRSAAALVSLGVTAAALVLLVGYAYDAPLMYGGSVLPVALPTAIGLFLLGGAIAAFGADEWPLVMLAGPSIRARLMRALVPLALVPLSALVTTDAVTVRLGFHDYPLVLAVLFVVVFSLSAGIVFRASSRIGGELEAAMTALDRSEASLGLALEASRMGTWTWEPDANRLEWSPQAKALLGLAPDSVMDDPTFRSMLHPDDRDATDWAVAQAIETLGEYDQEYRVIWPDGTLHWVHSLGRVTADESGHPILRGVKLDVTDRKEAEQRVEESRALMQAVIDGTPDIVYVKDLAGRYLFFNRAAERVSGKSAAEVLGNDDAFLYGSEEAEAIAARDRKVLEAGTTTTYEEQVAFPDGSAVHSLSTKGIVCDAEGVPRGMFGIIRDISERVESEAALSESEALLIQSQRAASVGHYVFDIKAGRWTSSRVLDEILGIGADFDRSVDGWVEVVYPEDREAMAAYLQKDVLDEHKPFDREYRIQRRSDGAVRWVRGLGSLEFDESGAPNTMFGVIQDITERELAEIAVRQLTEQLGRSLEAARNVIASVTAVISRTVEIRDPYTAGHQRRVTELALAIAERMGMQGDEVEELAMASLIHDVGKVAIPAEILSKPARLTAAEYEIVKEHSSAGCDIVASAQLTGNVPVIVYQHHERCDGSGYPNGFVSSQLLPGSKVLMVADVVEAMSSHRPYRSALGIEAARAEIVAGAGAQFDQEVVDACLRVLDAGFAFSDIAA